MIFYRGLMMKFKLSEAVEVIPLAKLDKRLDTESELYPVEHNLETMPPVPVQFTEKPKPVPGKKEKVYAHEDIEDVLREYSSDKLELNDTNDTELDDDLEEADFDIDEMESVQVSDKLPGTKYTVAHAKGAIDGILSKWMEMVRDFPEGEKRHNFLEIGERLSEIAAVLERDFIKGIEHEA